jgi:hypothetical protein
LAWRRSITDCLLVLDCGGTSIRPQSVRRITLILGTFGPWIVVNIDDSGSLDPRSGARDTAARWKRAAVGAELITAD